MLLRALAAIVFGGVLAVALPSASANHGWGHPHHHGYRGPGFGVAVFAPPPVVVAPPPYMYAPVYAAPPIPVPPPVPMGPPVVIPPPPPVYAPPYSYGIMGGLRGVGFGYSSPGFGVYVGR